MTLDKVTIKIMIPSIKIMHEKIVFVNISKTGKIAKFSTSVPLQL